jgi:hypothetical protein
MGRNDWLAVAVCMLLLVPGFAASEDARISLYTGELANNCNITDWGSKLHEVYVVYSGPSDFMGTEFRIEPTYDCGLTYLGEAIVEPNSITVGRTDTGIGVVTGACITTSPLLVLKVYYLGTGSSSGCSKLRILSDPRSPHQNGGKIYYIDCAPAGLWADPGHLVINPYDDCTCISPGSGDMSPVASTTWGGIKAMYTD